MLTTEDKKEIQGMIQKENARLIRDSIVKILPEILGRSLVQIKRFLQREIR